MNFKLLFLRQIMMIAFHPKHLNISGGGIFRKNVDWNWNSGCHLCQLIAPWVYDAKIPAVLATWKSCCEVDTVCAPS